MIRPGGTELTVMPERPTSRDRPLAHECIAALAQNAPLTPSGSDLPVMLTIRPHPDSIIGGSRRSVICRCLVKFRVMASSQASSGADREKARLPPALLT